MPSTLLLVLHFLLLFIYQTINNKPLHQQQPQHGQHPRLAVILTMTDDIQLDLW